MPNSADIDTQILAFDYDAGHIGGFILPFGVRWRPGLSGGMKHREVYMMPGATILTPKSGVWVMVHHYPELGRIGVVRGLLDGPDGLAIDATLFDTAARITFEVEGRTLPVLLQAGGLYFSPRLEFERPSRDIARDGRILRAILTEVSITEHPGIPKVVKQ